MLNRSHFIWCLLLAGLAGFFFYVTHSKKVFPSASIDMSMPRSSIQSAARDWAVKLGYNPAKSITATVFTFDDDAKTFLEYEMGTERANAFMKNEVPVWYWGTRFCQPLSHEEFDTWISPKGRLIAFEHIVPNDKAMPSVSDDEARTKAMEFARTAGGVDVSGFKTVVEAAEAQPARVDHSFSWEDPSHSYNGAKLRVHVAVSGNQVTAFNHFLYVPEAWTRKFKELRSYNDALEATASIFYFAIAGGAFFVYIWALAIGRIRWRFSLKVALLYAAISSLETLNGLPEAIYAYDTSLPLNAFTLQFALQVLSTAFSTFFQILILVGAGEAIYRLMKPSDVALEHTLSKIGLRNKKTVNNIAVGLAIFGIHLGWVCLYYLAGRKIGFWSPLEVDNAEALSSLVPFFSAIETGWSAGLTEELMYRVLGLAAFKKIVGNFWLANLLQAAAWAFMHSNYPQEPPYARGIELTVIGFVYGLVLKNFGFIACFFSHNLIDTFMDIEPLLTSSIGSLKASALLAVLPFVVFIAAAFYFRARHGVTTGDQEEAAENETIAPSQEPAIQAVSRILSEGYLYTPMRNLPRWILGAAASVCFLISLLFTTPMIAGHTHLSIDRAQAIKIAKECLLKNNVKVEPYKITAWLEKALDDDEMQYVFEVAKLGGADKLSTSPERPIRWEVRFFQPLTPEEYLVSIDQRGNVMSFTVEEPETQPGESISQDEALERVSKFLRTSHPEVVPFFFEDVTVEKREARIDYSFRFNVPKYKIGDAKYHVLVDCIGGRVSGYDSGWTLPDKWTLKKNIVTMREQICNCINFAFFFICAVGILIWARGVVRTGAISWRPAIVIGLGVTVFYLLSNANECMTFFSSYKNDTPLISYFIDEGVRYLVGAMTTFASATLLSAFGLASLRLLLPDTTVLAVLKSTFIPTSPAETTAHKHLWTDAVLLGYAAAAGDLCLTVLSTGARSLFSPVQLTAPLDIVSRYSNMFDPAIGAFLEAVQRGLFCVFAAAICVGVYARYLRTFKRFALFGILFGLVMVSSAKYWQNASLDFVGFSLAYLVLWLFIARLAKGNLLAYFLFGYASVLLLSLRVLLHFARALYMQDCAAILVLLLAPAAYAFIRTVGARPPSE